ncbi:DUF6512 family protein [Pseudothermotoga thermarum]|uniref:Uncharacterized protein n=1 Tax=Pseudothermotoga thermarum DSM 5069 TaxID=688269 RepID=F7YXV0_9THEM|nr:DUF6512 family protein [Pseudothermotoga thermarum]AEH50749.1 hypothetical protein Theth_0662 [Pseudothermotoga thermarum DSM 5069]
MRIFTKVIFYVLIFSLLHFGYELTGWDFLIPFCGIDESVFEHLKMGFWAYLLVSLLEFALLKRKHRLPNNFWFSRLISTMFIPWIIVVVWYVVPGIVGKVESIALELVWAFFVVVVSGIVGIVLERLTEKMHFGTTVKLMILILFFVLIFFFVRFSFSKPWVDLFQNPELVID